MCNLFFLYIKVYRPYFSSPSFFDIYDMSKIETRSGIWFEGFKKKSDFQTAVLSLLFSEEINDVVYVGLTSDVNHKKKTFLFHSENKKVRFPDKNMIKKKWAGLILLTEEPKYCIIWWVKKRSILKEPTLKKDGTPRKKYTRKTII